MESPTQSEGQTERQNEQIKKKVIENRIANLSIAER